MTTETGHSYNGASPVSGLTPAEKRRWMEGRYVHQKLKKDAQEQARHGPGPSSLSSQEYDVKGSRKEWLDSFSRANHPEYRQERNSRKQQTMQEMKGDIPDGDSVVTF